MGKIFSTGENEMNPLSWLRKCVRLKIKIIDLSCSKKDFGVIQKVGYVYSKLQKCSTCSPLFLPVHFTCRMLMNFFQWKIEEWKVRKGLFFFVNSTLKIAMLFTQIYIYDKNSKTIYMFTYKKSLRKCLHCFNKTFSNYQATY